MSVKVIQPQPPEKEVPLEVLADSITEISKFAKAINASRLGHRAIVLLIKDATGIGARDIELVLQVLPKLEEMYCKKPKA